MLFLKSGGINTITTSKSWQEYMTKLGFYLIIVQTTDPMNTLNYIISFKCWNNLKRSHWNKLKV